MSLLTELKKILGHTRYRHGAPTELVALAVLFLVCTGCRTAHHSQIASDDTNVSVVTSPPARPHGTNSVPQTGWHTIVHKPDPDKPPIRTINKFNPVWWFGNSDQPNPPDDYRPNDKARLFKWRTRNPFHNFTFYVIGIADKKIKRSGCHPEQTFRSDGGWNFAVTRYKWCPRPFVSWCHGDKGFHFYCGWRTAGNFGLKCNME
jgi:hypothetical protein